MPFLGRTVAGISSGLGFGTGAVWIRELSMRPSVRLGNDRRCATILSVYR